MSKTRRKEKDEGGSLKYHGVTAAEIYRSARSTPPPDGIIQLLEDMQKTIDDAYRTGYREGIVAATAIVFAGRKENV